MRARIIVAGLLLSTGALGAETMVVPDAHVPPSLSVEQPQNPVSSKPGGPILQSISARMNVREANGQILDIVPDFHFIAPNGNAVLLHREIVDTNANRSNVTSAPITIPAEAQKRGAVISGGWRCNVGQYYVTMKAYVLDSDGNRSNTVQYTVHCNGG